MAHEISRSTVAFFSESARELNLGRIIPFEFEDGETRTLPEQTLASFYTGTPHEWLFIGTFWDRLQLVVATPGELKWRPTHNDHTMVRAFTHIVNATIRLLESGSAPNHIMFSLYLYYDAHVPLMSALEDLKDVPNVKPLIYK